MSKDNPGAPAASEQALKSGGVAPTLRGYVKKYIMEPTFLTVILL